MPKIIFNTSKQTLYVGVILLIFVLISFLYFPAVIEGKVLDASDYNIHSGAAKELKDFTSATGEEALWTNSMFGGMPAYLILTHFTGNVFQPYFSFISLIPKPVNYLIVNFCIFFLMGLIFTGKPWISFAGALAYGFSTFFFILLGEGHVTKVQSISYISLLVGSIFLTYDKKLVAGSILTATSLSLILAVNHPQITYYAGILVFIMIVTYFVYAIRQRTLPYFIKASILLAAAAILAAGINFGKLITTYEYSKYSTRGKSELTSPEYTERSGLRRDYILDYSYSVGEALTAFIPRFRGGSNTEPLSENSETFRLMVRDRGEQEARKMILMSPAYWGDQPIARGPFYFGAVLCFLFVLGLFIVKGKERTWIIWVVIISFLLSLGKNIAFLSDFMIDHFPGYNKFRDVKNIIVIQHIAMAIMGLLAVREIYLRNIDPLKFRKILRYAFLITGGLAFIFIIFPGLAGNFQGNSDVNLTEMGWPREFVNTLIVDRRSMLRADAFRSFIFVTAAFAVIWGWWAKKIKPQYALLLWVVLIITDLWPVNKKYLNDHSFVSAKRAENTFLPTFADKAILQDKDPDYRVLNLTQDPFVETSTSYFHKSIGGSNGAKLRRYHEMIHFNIAPEISYTIKRLDSITTQPELELLLSRLNSINLLNTRYIILNPDEAPIKNDHAMGNAWFVSDYKVVRNADEEVMAIKDLKIDSTIVIDKLWEKQLAGKSFRKDPRSWIKLESYAPNRLVYQSSSSMEQIAVFSEVYYPGGWIVTIDGKEATHFRADFILRAMVIPAGNHEIVFSFKPLSYRIGNDISLASSALLVLIVIGYFLFQIRKRNGLKKGISDQKIFVNH
jgi:hypothetical protein